MKSIIKIMIAAIALAALSGTAYAKTKQQRIDGILEMRQKTLAELYEQRPQARKEVANAKGYAVFSNVGVQIAFVNAGGGTGVVRDHRTGGDVFMKMGTAGLGIGLGIKDFRAIFIFHDRSALDNFIDKGWDFQGQADAAAQINDVGGERGEAASASPKVTVYQFTENGLALQASLNGTKYWKDKKLNKYAARN